MSEEPQSKYPRVIWIAKDGKHRIVQTAAVAASKGKYDCKGYTPEKRGPDDAMGNESWQFTGWDMWALELADDYCKVLGDG